MEINFISYTKLLFFLFAFGILIPIKKNYAQADSVELAHQKALHALQIDMQDIYKVLPQTIMYNLWDKAKLYVNKSSYQYKGDNLVVKIPTNESGLDFIIAGKNVMRPERTLVYLLRYFPDSTSFSPQKYSGEVQWINMQDGMGYGIRYKNGEAVQYMTPVVIIPPNLEECMMKEEDFGIDENGKIIIREDLDIEKKSNTVK